jgi:hypothetical protein
LKTAGEERKKKMLRAVALSGLPMPGRTGCEVEGRLRIKRQRA